MALSRVDNPGRFEGELLVTEYVYERTLDGGADDELSSEEGEWRGIVRGNLVGDEETLAECDWLSPDDRAFLRAQAGVILSQSWNGFIRADYYVDADELAREWMRECITFNDY